MIETITNILWGPYTSVYILLVSIIVFVSIKGFYVFKPISTFIKFTKNSSPINMLTALGGSIGVGNIVGVALALHEGGPGSLFWMWICAIFIMSLKYAEVVLAVKYKADVFGGAMYYLKNLCFGKYFSFIFCLSCIVSSFGIGCAVQSNSVAKSAMEINISSDICGLLLAALCAFVIFGKGEKLLNISKNLVPAMSVFYIIGALTIIIINIKSFPNVLSSIIKSAFQFKSVFGGVSGSIFASALKQGMSKGIFSSEAGMGSTALMYSYKTEQSPDVQGVWAIIEVAIDTLLICSITGLAILCSGTDIYNSNNIPLDTFRSVFGEKSSYFLTISLFFFAFTSICCWNFYAKCCLKYLHCSKFAIIIYDILFLLTVYIGAISGLNVVWQISDIFNALMLYINSYGILGNIKEVICERNSLKD